MSGDGSYVVESDIKQQQYVDLIDNVCQVPSI